MIFLVPDTASPWIHTCVYFPYLSPRNPIPSKTAKFGPFRARILDNRSVVTLLVRGRTATQADSYISTLCDAPLRWLHEPHTPLAAGQIGKTLPAALTDEHQVIGNITA